MDWPVTDGVFDLGDLEVEHGGMIHGARLAWQTHGTLSPAKDNVIVYPCSFSATHADLEWLVRPDGILDPTRWFVVVPDMFSNGLSSGASTTQDYPAVVTAADNVRAQHRLLTELFEVDALAAVYGFSMGGQQAYHWAAGFPDQVERIVVVCGSARTATHNAVFLSGLLRLLEAAPEYLGAGRFATEPSSTLRAFSHIYAGWGLSQDFYRDGLYRSALGHADLASFLRSDWELAFDRQRATDLYSQLVTWQNSDISAGDLHRGDLRSALESIRARVLLMPSETDLYFRVADSAAELTHLGSAELHPIPSIWGPPCGQPSSQSGRRGIHPDRRQGLARALTP